jgi:hypothetical protein
MINQRASARKPIRNVSVATSTDGGSVLAKRRLASIK